MTIEEEIDAERDRAHAKHGVTSMRSLGWWAHRRHSILSEELGEVAKVLNDYDHDKLSLLEFQSELRKELIQTAAMAKDWVAAIDGEFDGPPHPDSMPQVMMRDDTAVKVQMADGTCDWVIMRVPR
jgi:hypothetical protein